MHKRPSGLLDRSTEAILSVLLGSPARWWYLSELARAVNAGPSSIQRTLARLIRLGVLERRKEGNMAYYRPDQNCPFLPELSGLIEKTAGAAGVLRDELCAQADSIDLAFIYGSVARGAEKATSDIDLMVIGELGLAEMSRPLRSAERRLGRPVNAVVYSRYELSKKLDAGASYPRSALDGEKLFVFGTEDHLAAIAGRRPRRGAQADRARTGRPPRRRGAKPQGRRGGGPVRG